MTIGQPRLSNMGKPRRMGKRIGKLRQSFGVKAANPGISANSSTGGRKSPLQRSQRAFKRGNINKGNRLMNKSVGNPIQKRSPLQRAQTAFSRGNARKGNRLMRKGVNL